MAVEYTLELFPSEENFKKVSDWFSAKERTNDNAGIDMYCIRDTVCPISQVTLLDLGVKARMLDPDGEPCHFWLAPRSSIWKKGVTQANSIGVIDRTYRGTLMGAVIPFQFQSATINEGDRLFQVLAPTMGHISRVIVLHESDLDETVRGSGGFGSTGR
jgi:dUTP pyrophosphatase